MHCLFFDVQPKPGHMEHYFAHVDRLKPVLAQHDGLVYLERFVPRDAPGALLSHQLWQDEAAIQAWRQDATHRASQAAGRRVHFESYRIRVGPQISEDAALSDRLLVARYGGPEDVSGGRVFESVTRPGYMLSLTEVQDTQSAQALHDRALREGAEAVRVFRITRDYTLTDRAEAPGDSPPHP